jgi:hypothetical protein
VALEGEGQVVLFAEGSGPALTASGEVRLVGLTVQGGATGLVAQGSLVLERVQLSGQRQAAVRMDSGLLRASGCTFQASVSDTLGLVLGAGVRAQVEDSAFLGPYWRGIQSRGIGRLSVERCRFEGPVTGLHQVGGEALVRRSTLSGGRGPALYMARGSLRVEQVVVRGHEYGLQTRQVDPLTVREFASVSADRAGLGLVESRADLEDVLVVDSGAHGGLQVVGGEVVARRLRIHHPESSGVNVRGAKLTLSGGEITAVQERGGSEGNAVELRGATATLEGVTVVGAAGIGVLAAEGSSVALRDLWLERCRWAGVAVETRAEVKGSSLVVRDSPGSALALPGEGRAEVDGLSSEHEAEGPVWAECERGAQVRLSRLRDDGPARTFPACVAAVRGREALVPRPNKEEGPPPVPLPGAVGGAGGSR